LQVEDCTFIATTTQATNDAAHVQCVAVHNGHYLDRADFLRCNFVQSKNILYAQALNNTVDGTADLRDCNVMAYTPFTARCGLITQQDGKRLAPADLWQYIDGYKWCHSVGDTVRVFSESVGINGWYNIAQVLPNTFAGRSKMPLWNLRIDGYYQRTGTAGWVSEDISVINSGGTYTNSYYNRYDAVFLVTHDLTNTTIKMEASTGSTVKFAGELRFVPSMSVFTNLSYGVAEGYLVINEEAPLLP
jgi:hypothetical protein